MTDSANIVKFPDRAKVREEAAKWVSICESRPLGRDRQEELHLWLTQSATHQEEFERLAALWGQLDILDELNYLSDIPRSAPQDSTWKVALPWAVAAMFVIGIGLFSLNLGNGHAGDQSVYALNADYSEKFATIVGEKRDVRLPDGSVVTLNTDSELRIAYSTHSRDVYLDRGESHFDVASDSSRPFSVHTSDGIVRAVGTAFSVKLDQQSVQVTVAEGRVKLLKSVEVRNNKESKIVPAVSESETEIAAGDYALMVKAKVEVLEPLSELELNRRMSWRRGLLAFAGEPLSEVVKEVGRYTDINIVIEDDEINDLPIGGYFKVGDIDGLLEALGQTFDLRVEYLDDNTVRLSQAA